MVDESVRAAYWIMFAFFGMIALIIIAIFVREKWPGKFSKSRNQNQRSVGGSQNNDLEVGQPAVNIEIQLQ